MPNKYRSKFEARVAKTVPPTYKYEAVKLAYTITHHYTPDFYDATAQSIIEAKGIWASADRTKMLAIKQAYPNVRIEIVFQNASLPIRKGSKTTYGDFCTKHGIQWRQA